MQEVHTIDMVSLSQRGMRQLVRAKKHFDGVREILKELSVVNDRAREFSGATSHKLVELEMWFHQVVTAADEERGHTTHHVRLEQRCTHKDLLERATCINGRITEEADDPSNKD